MESIAIAPSPFPPNLSRAASPPPFSPTNFFPPLLPQLPLLKPSSSSPPFLAHPILASSLLNGKTRFQLGGELFRPFFGTLPSPNPGELSLAGTGRLTRTPQRTRAIGEEFDVPPVKSDDAIDQEHGSAACLEMEGEDLSSNNVGGFSGDGPYIFDRSAPAPVGAGNGANEVQVLAASQTLYQPRFVWFARSEEEESQHLDRAINGTIAGAVGIFTITKILTVDHDYWQGWTVFEILRYAPIHNWSAYEDALKHNPILAKMMISGAVYSLGDWIAQCYEGKPILDFNRTRMFRSGLVGFCLHGSLSHFYYYLCEALFPFKEWWVVPVKVAFDQTIWSGVWNSIYYVTLGLLRFESPSNILSELKATFWPLLTAGWKLWPFAHVITYGVVPVEQRLLWVDCVELVWVTILSMYSNEKAEARILEASNEAADVTLLEHEGNSSEVQ